MVTIDEIKSIGQLSVPEHMLEESQTFPYVSYVLRKISPYFTKFFIESGASPNQASFFSILFGIIGNLMFVSGNYYLILLGCVFYQFWNIFDLVDGEMARVTNVRTLGGKYLETINEVITETGFIVCLGIGLSEMFATSTFAFLGLFFALSISLLNFFARTRDVTAIAERNKPIGNKEKQSRIRKIYKKARLFFVIINGYLILTVIVAFELILSLLSIKFYFTLFGQPLTILSTYFLLYGLTWVVRATVSSVTNYKYLMRSEKPGL